MVAVVNCFARRCIILFVAGLGLLACIDTPEFRQADETSASASSGSSTTTTPPSSAPDAAPDADAPPDDDEDDPSNYVPDGGVAGPGSIPCGGKLCAVGGVCCKDKCKKPKSKC